MFDYHVHTHFSADCTTDMREIVIDAVKNNLHEICFTDHLDYDCTDKSITFDFDSLDYIRTIGDLQKEFDGQISIKRGIEVGIQPHILERCSKRVQNDQPDFVLASMHGCDRKDFYLEDFFNDRTPKEAVDKYYEELIHMVNHFNDYSVLGHLDIYKRYSAPCRNVSFNDYRDHLEQLFKVIIKNNKGIEINTSGLRGGLGETLPHSRTLEMYYEMGGKILTLGSDSHGTGTLCADFDTVLRELKRIGFKDVFRFNKMNPIDVRIEGLL